MVLYTGPEALLHSIYATFRSHSNEYTTRKIAIAN